MAMNYLSKVDEEGPWRELPLANSRALTPALTIAANAVGVDNVA
jgi:hypothetical protein